MGGWSQFRALLARDYVLTLRGAPEVLASLVFAAMVSAAAGYASSVYAFDWAEQALAVAPTLAAVLLFEATFLAAYGYAREAALGLLDIVRSQPVTSLLLFTARTVYYATLLEIVALTATATAAILGGLQPGLARTLALSLSGLALYLAPIAGVASAISTHIGASPVIPPAIIAVLSAPAVQSTITAALTGSTGPILLSITAALGLSMVAAALADELA